MSDCTQGGRRAYNAPTHSPAEDRLEITVHFYGEFNPHPIVLNRLDREVDYVTVDGERYERVVRCRDCSWFCEGSEVFVTYDWCRNFDCETNEDGYCAWSERRADA